MKKKEDKIENEDTINENAEKENKELKKGFFKKVWYSIEKIEKYSELSAEGLKSAIKYLIELVLIMGIVSSLATIYKTNVKIKQVAEYINTEIPEISYNNETLKVESEEVITDEKEEFGKIVIDTNTDDEQQINQYINEINEEENGIIVLKNKLVLKQVGITGTANYEYKDLFGQMGITEFNKQSLVEYLTGKNMISIYATLFCTLTIYSFIISLINTLFYIIIVSIFGYLTTIILKLKIRYVAIFNMAVYAITLPTLLNIIYIGINTFLNYRINYFDVMFMLVSSIYMIAAVFILKTEFNKKQGEVQKIVEVEKEVKEEIENQKENKKENQENKKDKDNKNKKEDSENNEKPEDGQEPEGSNA